MEDPFFIAYKHDYVNYSPLQIRFCYLDGNFLAFKASILSFG
jgi:hypothetical protein